MRYVFGPDVPVRVWCPHAPSWPPGNRCQQSGPVPQRFADLRSPLRAGLRPGYLRFATVPATPNPARIFPSNPHQYAAPQPPEYGWPNEGSSPTEKSKTVCCWRSLPIPSRCKIPWIANRRRDLHSARRERQRARLPLPFQSDPEPNTQRFVPPPEAPDNGGVRDNAPIAYAPDSQLAQPQGSLAPLQQSWPPISEILKCEERV